MSDRLNLWPEGVTWAEVNLSNHVSMADAIRRFANHQQVLNVYGPPDAIERCKRVWRRLQAKDPDFPRIDAVTWVVQSNPFKVSGER